MDNDLGDEDFIKGLASILSELGLNDKTCCFPACRVKRQIVLVGVGV